MDVGNGLGCSHIVRAGVDGGEQLSVLLRGGFKVECRGVQVRVGVYVCGAVSRGGHDMRCGIGDRDGLGEVVRVANSLMGMKLCVADDSGCDTYEENGGSTSAL